MKKCWDCEHCRQYVDKKGVNGRLFTMVCIKNFPDTKIIEIFDNMIDESKWKEQKCIKR